MILLLRQVNPESKVAFCFVQMLDVRPYTGNKALSNSMPPPIFYIFGTIWNSIFFILMLSLFSKHGMSRMDLCSILEIHVYLRLMPHRSRIKGHFVLLLPLYSPVLPRAPLFAPLTQISQELYYG